MTHVIFLLDESGSMASVITDVLGGFAQYLELLKADETSYTMTVLKFGTRMRAHCSAVPLASVPALTTKNYVPLENTALYDALAYAFAEEKKRVASEAHPYGTEPVLCIIFTDGEENASRHATKAQIVAQIKKREEAGNWTFVYLGADQDGWAIAQELGLPIGNVLSYTSDSTIQTFQNLATATSATRGFTQTHTFFTK